MTPRCLLLVTLLLLVRSFAYGDDMALRHVIHVFTLPKAEGLALLAQDMDDRALFDHLQTTTKTTPEVLEKLLVITSAEEGELQLLQSDQLIYPTEFDPQQLPQTIAIGDSKLVTLLNKLLDPEPDPPQPPPQAVPVPKPAPPPTEEPAPRHPVNAGLGVITSITPTAFELRDLGDQLALGLGEGGMTLSFSCTRLAGMQNFNGELCPQFASRKLVTCLPRIAGVPLFLGTLNASQKTGGEFENPKESVSLAFLTSKPAPLPVSADRHHLAKDATDVLARLEVFSLLKTNAAALVGSDVEDNVFYSRLTSAVTAGSARLEAILSRRVPLDDEVEISECDEHIYPVEFDPPQVVRELVIADNKLIEDLRAGRQTGTGVAPPAANPHNGGFGLMTKVSPTGFETRSVGTQLVINVARDEQQLTLTATPKLSRLLGHRTYAGVGQPMFGVQSLTTSRPARLGVPLLLGTLSRPLDTGLPESEKEDRLWFAFITLRE